MTHSFDLRELGWTAQFERHMAAHRERGHVPGRVAVQHRGAYVVYTEAGETTARLPGRMRRAGADIPAVGDWVALRPLPNEPDTLVETVLPRAGRFSRHEAGRVTREQVVAANVDVAFLVVALDRAVNARRLERYVTTAWSGGATPVVVLTKPDLYADVDAAAADAAGVAPGISVHVVNGLTGQGVEALTGYLTGNRTAALLGVSGAGKSTLLNLVAGEEVEAVAEVRHDGRGRHTTTVRHLFPVSGGGLLLDTPGMRELQLWDDDSMDQTFADVAALAELCRFRDCRHEREPGCAVAAAHTEGRLPAERLTSYRKLQGELEHLRVEQDRRASAEQRRRYRDRLYPAPDSSTHPRVRNSQNARPR